MKQNKLPGVSVFVLHYNDAESSLRCLGSLYESLPGYDGPTELYLIDNGSTDDSVSILKKRFPNLKVIRYEDSKQVAKSFTPAARDYAKFSLICIILNDMEAKPGFLEPLARHFGDKDVFAVNPAVLSPEGKIDYGRNIGARKFGLFYMRRGQGDTLPDGARPTYSFSPSMVGVFDKKKFLELGGPDPLYHPTYYDDYDLGFCAWKREWKVIFEPSSRIIHRHKSQLKKTLGEREAMLVDRRNRHLFIWKNYDNASLFGYLFYLPFILVLGTLKNGPDYLRSFYLALKKIPEVRGKRKREERERRFSDGEIFRLSAGDLLG